MPTISPMPPDDLEKMKRLLKGAGIVFEEETVTEGEVEIRIFERDPSKQSHVVMTFDPRLHRLHAIRAWE